MHTSAAPPPDVHRCWTQHRPDGLWWGAQQAIAANLPGPEGSESTVLVQGPAGEVLVGRVATGVGLEAARARQQQAAGVHGGWRGTREKQR